MLRMFLLLDPPDHTRLRRVVAPAFTPSAMSELRPTVTRCASGLLPADACDIDLIVDLAYPLPLTVICELLGVPEDDRAQFAAWSRVLTHALDDPLPTSFREIPAVLRSVVERRSHPIAAVRAGNGIVRYARDALDRAVADPPSDIVDRIGHARRSGEISADEAVATWIMLMIAGHETTANLVGNGVLALLQQRDALAQLAERPELLPAAVDELLRYDSPVPYTGRVAREDANIGGVANRAGTWRSSSWPQRTAIPTCFPIPTGCSSTARRLRRRSASRTASTSVRVQHSPASKPRRHSSAVLPRLDERQDLTLARRRPSVAVRGLDSFPLRLNPA